MCRRSVVAALAASLMMVGLMLGVAQTPAAADPPTSVTGSACGYYVNVGILGGPQALRGCGGVVQPLGAHDTPSPRPPGYPAEGQPVPPEDGSYSPLVTLPSGGSASAITASDPDGAAAWYGPAPVFAGIWDNAAAPPSGPQYASTQGTPEGGVTSSADITTFQTPTPVQCDGEEPGTQNCEDRGGYGPFPVWGDSLHVECSASAAGVLEGSTTLQNAKLATLTDGQGSPIPSAVEDIVPNPPVNFTRHGYISNVSDTFAVVYNEHLYHADGSLTVNAVHMYLFGPNAIGHIIKGSVTCGVHPAPGAAVADTLAPFCDAAIINQFGPQSPWPTVPRSELVGVFDAGHGDAGSGLQSITNIQATNATVTVGGNGGPPFEQPHHIFTPGQIGPLSMKAKQINRNLPMSWSFTATDVAGNVSQCTGVEYAGPRTISVGDISVAEGDSGPTIAQLTLTRTGDLWPATVKYKTSGAGGGAACTPGVDYITVAPTIVEFDVGEASDTVNVQLCGDTVSEANEIVTVTLLGQTGVLNAPITIADATARLTIVNDDARAFFSVDDPWATEGGGVQFTVTRSGNITGTSTVKYKTALGSATADADYASVALQTLTFAPEETFKTVTTTTTDDATDEVNETFNLVLSAPVGAVIADTAGTATIVDNDGVANPAAPSTFLSVADISMNEGSEPGTATFTILRSGDLSGSSTVSYRTTGGNATPGSDYTAVAVTPFTFAPLEDVKTVDVSVLGDNLVEVNETFSLALSLPSKYTNIADGAGVATLFNDDGATYLSVGDISWAEGTSSTSTTPFTFTITRSGNTNGQSSALYKTSGGTALAGTDYTAITTGTVDFLADQTTKTVTVNVTGDAIREANDTFNLVLTNPVGATLSDAAGMATILNDEPPPVITIEDISGFEGNSGTTPFVFTITRTGNTTASSTVSYKTYGGTASTADFTAKPLTVLSFAAG